METDGFRAGLLAKGCLAAAAWLATGLATVFAEPAAPEPLRVAVYEHFAPYSCSAEGGGALFGVDVEIARALGERLDRPVELLARVADDSMEEDLEVLDPPELDVWGQPVTDEPADLLMHAPQDPVFAARNDGYAFVAPYYFESMAVLYDRRKLGKLPAQVSTAEPFLGSRVGVELYTLSYTFLTNGFSGQLRDATRVYDRIADAIVALGEGEVAAVFAPRTELQSALALSDVAAADLGLAEVINLFRTDRVRSSWDVGVAVREADEDLHEAVSAAMAEMLADGTVARIMTEFGIPPVPPIGTMDGNRGEVAGVGVGGRGELMATASRPSPKPECPGGAAAGLL